MYFLKLQSYQIKMMHSLSLARRGCLPVLLKPISNALFQVVSLTTTEIHTNPNNSNTFSPLQMDIYPLWFHILVAIVELSQTIWCLDDAKCDTVHLRNNWSKLLSKNSLNHYLIEIVKSCLFQICPSTVNRCKKR